MTNSNVIADCGRRRRRGSIAVALVIALVVLQLIVVGMVVAGSRDQALAVHRAESLRTLYAAESGLNMSIRELAVAADEDGDGTIGSVSADGSNATGPVLLGSRISTELVEIDSTSGEIVAGSLATQASRNIRAAYSLAASGSGGGVGLAAEYFPVGTTISSLAGVNWSAVPAATGAVPYVYFTSASDGTDSFWMGGPSTQYGVRLTGRIEIQQAGVWTFRVGSDDGSRVLIDGVQVVSYDGTHSFGTRDGSATLAAGMHDIQILFYENTGVHGLTLAWQGPGVSSMTTIPPWAFSLDVAPSPDFPPIALTDFLYIWGDSSSSAAYIDAFDASAGVYGGANVMNGQLLVSTNATGNQKVQMSGLAQVRGSLQVGPGGTPSSVVALWGGSQITGGTTARSKSAGIHRSVDPYVTMPSSLGSQTYTSSFTISSNRTYADLNVWGNSTIVTITGNVIIRCSGSFNIGDQVEFQLAAGATLTMYVAGDVNIYTQAKVNANTGDPSRCWMFLTGDSRNVQLTDRAKLVAHVRNPKGALQMYGTYDPGSELYGTFHGKSATITDKARFHADVSLLHPGSGSGGGGVSISSWAVEP